MANELEHLLDQLKEAREEATIAKEQRRKMLDELSANAEYLALEAKEYNANDLIARLEAQIKQQALGLHELCAELPKRVSVKNFKIVEYELTSAREWCFVNFRPALKLDEKTFEKEAKDGNIPADIAVVKTEARAQIATKL